MSKRRYSNLRKIPPICTSHSPTTLWLLLLSYFFLVFHSVPPSKHAESIPITDPTAVPIYIISMERSKDRQISFPARMKGLNYSVHVAADSSNFTLLQRKSVSDVAIAKTLSPPGSIGCLISHVSLWENIVADRIPCALILEDDFLLADDFPQTLSSFVEIEGYDLMYLGHCYESPNGGHYITTVGKYEVHVSIKPLCTHAYLITYKAAKLFVEYLHRNRATHPIDDMLLIMYRDLYLRYMSVIPPAAEIILFPSTIRG